MSRTVFPSPRVVPSAEGIPTGRRRRFSWSPASSEPDPIAPPDDPWFRELAELGPPGEHRTLPRHERAHRDEGIHEVPRPALPDRRRHLIDELRFRCSDPRLRAIALGLVAIAAGVFWYVSGTASDGSAASRDGAIADAQAAVADAGADEDGPSVLTVHVAGAVAEPGVVELVAGSRIIDALEAVGGGTADADLDQLNLAASLADGQRILVPKVGETLPLDSAGVQSGDDGTGAGGLLNLNTATKTQLQELPGIGPVLAESIISDRDKRGGYRAVEDLRGVSGIGDKRFEDIKDLVTVG